MARIKWDKYSIAEKCEELGIEFLSEEYNHKENQLFRCSCGRKFFRKFSNVLSNNQVHCLQCSENELAEKNRKRALDNFNEMVKFVNESNFGIEILATFDDYKNNKTPLKTLCKCGNIYYPTANSLKRSLNTQCKKCGDAQAGLGKRKPKEEIREFIESYGYKAITYEFRDKRHWMEVSCQNENHDSYWVDWGNFYIGNRCPQCNISKGEEKVKRFFESRNISFNREVKLDNLLGINGGSLRFDFEVIMNDNTYYIEYDGEQHFKPKFGEYEFERTVKNDKIKNQYCTENNLNLLRIPYTEYDNVENILKKYLKID